MGTARARPLDVSDTWRIPADELRVETATSGGPGGQHVNRTETQVILRFALAQTRSVPESVRERVCRALAHRITQSGELVVRCSQSRSQQQNLERARERMAELLRRAARPPKPRKATRPTRGSKERRLKEKRRRSETKRQRRSRGDE